MNKKKLTVGVFTYDFFPIFGGQGRHLYELYKQNQLQNKISMFVFSPSTNNLKNHIQQFPETKTSRFKNIEYSIKTNKVFEKLIKEYSLDIVHIHGGPGGIFLFKKLSIPVIYTAHHTYWQQSTYIKEQGWKKIFYFFEKISYQLADMIICVSTDTKKTLINHYKITDDKLTFIPNGINQNNFSPIKKLKENNKELLYVGRIDKRKGVDFLIEAMKKINKTDENILLNIVGDGKDKNKLEQISKQNNLSVKFHGFISDKELQKIYKRSSIQIVPSVFEGFGISVLEGMAKGIPIIASNVDGIKDIIHHGHSGLLVKYGNAKELASSIINLLNNKSLQSTLVKNAYNELSKYRWDKIYQNTVKQYEKLV